MSDISLFLKMKVVNRSTSIVVNRSTSVSDVTQFLVQNSKKNLNRFASETKVNNLQTRKVVCFLSKSKLQTLRQAIKDFIYSAVCGCYISTIGKENCLKFCRSLNRNNKAEMEILFFSTSMMETTQLHFQK